MLSWLCIASEPCDLTWITWLCQHWAPGLVRHVMQMDCIFSTNVPPQHRSKLCMLHRPELLYLEVQLMASLCHQLTAGNSQFFQDRQGHHARGHAQKGPDTQVTGRTI